LLDLIQTETTTMHSLVAVRYYYFKFVNICLKGKTYQPEFYIHE
jgi:hypothetical protein